MNKITATGLTEPTDVDFGQVYCRKDEYYIVASPEGAGNTYLLVSLSNGHIWTSLRNKEDTLKELKEGEFKKFKGTLTLEIE